MSTRTKKTSINFIVGVIYQFVFLFSQFILRSVIIQKLGAEYLGLSSVVTSILTVLNLTEMGFASAIVFSLYKPLVDGDKSKIRALLWYYRKIYKIIGFIIMAIGLAITPFLHSFINQDVPTDVNIYIIYLVYLVNTVLSYLLFSYKRSILIADQKNYFITIVNLSLVLVQTIVQITLLILFKNFYLFVFTLPFITLINNLLIAIITRKYYKDYFVKEELDTQTKEELKIKISGLFIIKLANSSRTGFDNIFISAFLGLSLVAIHSNYYYIVTGVGTFLGIVTNSMSASVGNKVALDTVENNYKDFNKFDFMYMVITGICCITMFVLYQPFMSVWVGDNMLLPFGTMCSFVVYFYCTKMYSIRSMYNDVRGLWWEQKFRTIFEAIANIILNLILVIYLGVLGIMLASIITMLIFSFGMSSKITFKHYFGNDKLKNYYINHAIYAIVTIFIALIVYYTSTFITVNNLYLEIILKGIFALSVSSILYFILYLRNRHMKQNINLIKKVLLKIKSTNK